eukprot:TRINITY_DN2362_c0_g1_i3.p1 TRINITY_DN2362_c0_g1~~TRINITY_DN2362_c0_g1_i3.p1  ORF type:complete len:250 (-),score=82.94 TRINITY_DN2362_c0_g1_i3:25-774(-)
MKRMGTVINPEFNVDLRRIGMFDCGDIEKKSELEEGHQLLRRKVKSLIENNAIPFVVGGGNDQSFPNGSGLIDVFGKDNVGVVNIDAHLDVRPLKNGKTHSGSPFRQLIEESGLSFKKFVEFAAQGNQCSAEHAAYVIDNGGEIVWLKDLKGKSVAQEFSRVLDKLGDNIFVSFDIDSITGADCPGVSAVGTIGITAQDALDICFAAGANSKVKLFDLSEYNPTVELWRTGRLVSNMFYFFCLGVASRS